MIHLEQRRAERMETRKAGQIVLTSGLGLRCAIRNLSQFGACLQVASHFGVPRDIVLEIEGEQSKRPCRIVWRSNNQLGVLFSTTQVAKVKAESERFRFNRLFQLRSPHGKKVER
jgi:hypothetical protein